MKSYDKVILATRLTLAMCALGLFVSMLLRKLMGMTEHEFMGTPVGGPLVWILSGGFITALFVLLPLALHRKEKVEGTLVPNLPRWIGWTIRGLLFICVGILVLLLIGGSIAYFLLRTKG